MMSSEINTETMTYLVFPPIPPQEREVLSIINPNDLNSDNTSYEQETPVLQRNQSNKEVLEEPFIKGIFLYITDKHSREMLVNAWNAITEVDMWNYMRNKCYSYMLSNDREIDIIYNKMEELGYNGHSGCSFAWTMRQMQYIAQHGEEKYAEEIIRCNTEKSIKNNINNFDEEE